MEARPVDAPAGALSPRRGIPASRSMRELVDRRPHGSSGGRRLLPRQRHRPRRCRAGGAAGRRPCRRSCRRGVRVFGPTPRSGSAGRLQGLHEGSLRGSRYSDCGLSALRRRVRQARSVRTKRARRSSSRRTVSQAARASPWQTTVDEALAAIAICFGGSGGDEVVIEECLNGEEASFFALTDGDDDRPARDGAGPQARARRRHRPEHRRHGRISRRRRR